MDNKGTELNESKNILRKNTTIELSQNNDNFNQHPNLEVPIIDKRYSRGFFQSPSMQTEVKKKYGKCAGLLHAITMEYLGMNHTLSLF